ncbi:MAG: hypothetical protein KJ621_17065 [Proteobacteria bacterium]|nr:hypothetical protein [Pseudomonadota bacterium]MBU1742722.1 hypothetical protein [Pseudomonadota bacterium]
MAEHTITAADEGAVSLNGILEPGPKTVSGAEGRQGVATTLGDLVMALQDVTDDDRLVLAVVRDLMSRGALKRPETGSVH